MSVPTAVNIAASIAARVRQAATYWPLRTAWALAVLTLVPVAAAASMARASMTAHAARSVSVKDEGKLHFRRSSGSTLTDEGPVTGTFPGTAKVLFVYNGNPTVSAQITIYGRYGSIRAHGNGKLANPTSPNPSFKGALVITGGTGRYARAHGNGHLYGVFHRRSYGLLVQTEGILSY